MNDEHVSANPEREPDPDSYIELNGGHANGLLGALIGADYDVDLKTVLELGPRLLEKAEGSQEGVLILSDEKNGKHSERDIAKAYQALERNKNWLSCHQEGNIWMLRVKWDYVGQVFDNMLGDINDEFKKKLFYIIVMDFATYNLRMKLFGLKTLLGREGVTSDFVIKKLNIVRVTLVGMNKKLKRLLTIKSGTDAFVSAYTDPPIVISDHYDEKMANFRDAFLGSSFSRHGEVKRIKTLAQENRQELVEAIRGYRDAAIEMRDEMLSTVREKYGDNDDMRGLLDKIEGEIEECIETADQYLTK